MGGGIGEHRNPATVSFSRDLRNMIDLAFDKVDKEKKGEITEEDIQKCFKRFPEAVAKAWLENMDQNKDRTITKAEFLDYFRKVRAINEDGKPKYTEEAIMEELVEFVEMDDRRTNFFTFVLPNTFVPCWHIEPWIPAPFNRVKRRRHEPRKAPRYEVAKLGGKEYLIQVEKDKEDGLPPGYYRAADGRIYKGEFEGDLVPAIKTDKIHTGSLAPDAEEKKDDDAPLIAPWDSNAAPSNPAPEVDNSQSKQSVQASAASVKSDANDGTAD